jgi:5-methylcytosine-specific restriction protein B
MNTADRSIALIDAALRRRFYFQAFYPTEEPIRSVLPLWLHRHGLKSDASELLEELNRLVGDDDVSIGPSYFMTRDAKEPDVARIWQKAILPLLDEYYQGTGRQVSSEFSLTRLRRLVAERLGSDGQPPTTEAL